MVLDQDCWHGNRYLVETYEKSTRLLPSDRAHRVNVRVWVSAAEGTFLVHALAILYGSGAAPDAADTLQAGLAGVSNANFLVDDGMKIADTMIEFSVVFILKMGFGTKGRSWPAVEKWLANVQNQELYKKAV
ncbi:hypothetical protein EJ05DRAFT_510552 [Pseudovirgaria hyperparasitica]|uniref:Uncharacterized protein n=1 Tax=Pseudovirgaria hyperparasitica TaxID=470096 RepID=A0A6A6W719_9PEZI|nr:uncharacterized protein EJ05DRAFT_510552 [Pseudovirgaria hyperparasitica]KAF2758652.1 hypothetical protein EJ05DRAFT_510552 [Pseudovirgaria hyperparasitica]